jgi:Mg2+ and Co2+ transporter CorA
MASIRPLLHEGFSWVKRETNIPNETMKAVKLHKESNKLEQFHHENLTWVRSLDFFKQENNYLKNRLSEVVDITSDKSFLAQAEHFQNQFIIKDEFVDELKHDINEQERILMDKYIKTGIGIDDIIVQRQKNLREQIEYLEKDFTNLRNEFNNYLTQIL